MNKVLAYYQPVFGIEADHLKSARQLHLDTQENNRAILKNTRKRMLGYFKRKRLKLALQQKINNSVELVKAVAKFEYEYKVLYHENLKNITGQLESKVRDLAKKVIASELDKNPCLVLDRIRKIHAQLAENSIINIFVSDQIPDAERHGFPSNTRFSSKIPIGDFELILNSGRAQVAWVDHLETLIGADTNDK